MLDRKGGREGAVVRAGFKPSRIKLSYHKFGLNLFGSAAKS